MTVARRGDALRLVDAAGVDFASVRSAPPALPRLDVDLDLALADSVAAGLARGAGDPAAPRPGGWRTVGGPQPRRRPAEAAVRGGRLLGGRLGLAHKAEVLAALLPQHAQRYDVAGAGRADDRRLTRGPRRRRPAVFRAAACLRATGSPTFPPTSG